MSLRIADTKQIYLAGAGLAGSLLAIYLARRGFQVQVFERRPDSRKVKLDAGRSINLAISTRGLAALAEIGLTQKVLDFAIPMSGRYIHHEDLHSSFQPYSEKESQAINSISRAGLNQLLMTEAENTGKVQIHFESGVEGVDFAEREMQVRDGSTLKKLSLQNTVLLATDGSFSAVRNSLRRQNLTREEIHTLPDGYKELSIPPLAPGKFRMESHALHIWPRKRFMLIALPNLDGSFTCTLFLPNEGPISFANLKDPASVSQFFKTHFKDALAIMPTLTEDFFSNPLGKLQTVRCFPWHVEDKALLLGDAAHGIVPFYGQGMNAAFESCQQLVAMLDDGRDQKWDELFSAYSQRRKPNTDAIAAMALENFIEMRDLVGDEHFLKMKEVSHLLAERFSNEFVSQYSLVTFSQLPYAFAQACGGLQNQMLGELCEGLDTPKKLNWELAEKKVRKYALDVKNLQGKWS